jgi:hypothetical protein
MRLVSGGCGRLRMGLSRLWRGGECRRSARQMEETNCDCCRLGDELWLYMGRVSGLGSKTFDQIIETGNISGISDAFTRVMGKPLIP